MNFFKKISVVVFIFSLAISFTVVRNALAAATPSLGNAAVFSVLAGLSMSAAGPGTTVSGNLGLSPGLEVSRTGPWTVGGSEYFGTGGLSENAQTDALDAFNDLAGQASDGTWGVSPWSPVPGVWTATSDITFSGTITLNGDFDDVWIFQVEGDMTFSGDVVLTGNAQPCNVSWQTGRDATIASDSAFVGTLIASRDITLVSGATVNGRVISLNSSLTTDGNTISGPTCMSAPRTSTISGQKWNDENSDRQSDGESGITGWVMNIFADGSLVGTTTTDSSGDYSFADLNPELDYWVCEETQSGWVQTSPISASDGTVACPNGTVGYIAQAGDEADDFINKDFGNHLVSGPPPPDDEDTNSVSGMKWNDVDGNGTKNNDDDGLSGWLISIFADALLIGTTTTGSSGNYSFNNLNSTLDYLVCEEARGGWNQTSPTLLSDGTVACSNGTVGYSAQAGEGADDFTNKNFGNYQNTVPVDNDDDDEDDDEGDDDEDSSTSRSGGGSSRRRTTSSSGEVLGAVPGEVLAEQIVFAPVGAPATGFGGLKMCIK